MTEHQFPYGTVEFVFKVAVDRLTAEIRERFPALSEAYEVEHEGEEDDAEPYYSFTWSNGVMTTPDMDAPMLVPFTSYLAFIGVMAGKANGYHEGLTIRLKSKLERDIGGGFKAPMVEAYWTNNKAMDIFNRIKVNDDTITGLSAAKLELLEQLAGVTDISRVANALGALRPS